MEITRSAKAFAIDTARDRCTIVDVGSGQWEVHFDDPDEGQQVLRTSYGDAVLFKLDIRLSVAVGILFPAIDRDLRQEAVAAAMQACSGDLSSRIDYVVTWLEATASPTASRS